MCFKISVDLASERAVIFAVPEQKTLNHSDGTPHQHRNTREEKNLEAELAKEE